MQSLKPTGKAMVRSPIGFVLRTRVKLPSQQEADIKTLGDLRTLDPHTLQETVTEAGRIGENRANFLNAAFKRPEHAEQP